MYGLEEIGEEAFRYCELMEEIDIPDNVRKIKYAAFASCTGLTRVTLGDGLEEIGEEAFRYCESMEEIDIPDNVRKIKYAAFASCTGLTRLTLGDGLEVIEGWAFQDCESMEGIVIPPAVRDIQDTAFRGCRNLTRVKFSDEIEDFVACDAMRDWWNKGVHEKSLRTYCFLVRCGIPARLGLVEVRSWQVNIYDMLGPIPTISVEGLDAYLDTIDAKLSFYESLSEVPEIMGLAIPNIDIVLRVLSFV